MSLQEIAIATNWVAAKMPNLW